MSIYRKHLGENMFINQLSLNENSNGTIVNQAEQSTHKPDAKITSNKTVLYIEDNMDNAIIVKGILSHEGYTVHIAHDGEKGLALAEYLKPDVIITDFHLPNMNGPEVVKSLRSNESFKNTPIMMLTADIYNKSASQAAGIDSYLNKPIRYNKLLVAVQQLIDNQSEASDSS